MDEGKSPPRVQQERFFNALFWIPPVHGVGRMSKRISKRKRTGLADR